jgi:capsule biosynthesis phosphatase
MIVLIPLGGLGLRFKNLGYKLPKPLINVMGKSIIFWLLDNLNLNNIDFVIIPYNNELSKYRFESLLIKTYPNINFKFIKLNKETRGASETIKITLDTLTINDQPILCLDGDNFYLTDIINNWDKNNQVFVFNDDSKEAAFSYVKTKNDIIYEIKEKEKISNNACTGAYGFSSWKQLLEYCNYIIDNNITHVGEFYISTVIGEMIKKSISFKTSNVDKNKYICLGTPLHVRLFCNNFPKISAFDNTHMIKKQRYCFDLDNTLVTFPKIKNDYTSVEPIYNNINFLKYLKSLGHEIIIYTARNMKTHNGNIGKCISNIGKITFDTLDKFDIQYDEIYFGKPYADYYIDDLAISSFEDMEKEFGFYNSTIEPRSFNSLYSTNIQLYKKSSDNKLDGEIYYYNNIPKSIKDMFPFMFNYDVENYTWYEMEMINGIPVSKLYLSEELSIDLLGHIMKSLTRIHTIELNDNINIYGNYSEKISKRYNSFDYTIYPESECVYNNLIDFFKDYELNGKGSKKVIHGDPVLTNILINQFGKIKFIDMRGKINNSLTITGDVFYDWAKLYQSLIGYDEILFNKQININYKKNIINNFIEYFLELYSEEELNNVKYITKSLLFTLIPLHYNEKCIHYYNLIQSEYLKIKNI